MCKVAKCKTATRALYRVRRTYAPFSFYGHRSHPEYGYGRIRAKTVDIFIVGRSAAVVVVVASAVSSLPFSPATPPSAALSVVVYNASCDGARIRRTGKRATGRGSEHGIELNRCGQFAFCKHWEHVLNYNGNRFSSRVLQLFHLFVLIQ